MLTMMVPKTLGRMFPWGGFITYKGFPKKEYIKAIEL
jgi:hypothetical protein